jgi:hypothetical protein
MLRRSAVKYASLFGVSPSLFVPTAFGPQRMVALELPGVPDIEGVIGSNFFASHRVCFDYARGTVSVQ